jgi:hypothetical protein
MRTYPGLCILAVLATSYVGCSSSVTLNPTHATISKPNKLKVFALVYIPSELCTRQIVTHPQASCLAFTSTIDAGSGYMSAIRSGLEGAMDSVEIMDTLPTPEMARLKHADMVIAVSLQNEEASIRVSLPQSSAAADPSYDIGLHDGHVTIKETKPPSGGSGLVMIQTRFQCSIGLDFAGRDGQALYSCSVNGNGSAGKMSYCPYIADALSESVTSALQQIANHAGDSFCNAAQLRDYEKGIGNK